jgi:hypothetical protein
MADAIDLVILIAMAIALPIAREDAVVRVKQGVPVTQKQGRGGNC